MNRDLEFKSLGMLFIFLSAIFLMLFSALLYHMVGKEWVLSFLIIPIIILLIVFAMFFRLLVDPILNESEGGLKLK